VDIKAWPGNVSVFGKVGQAMGRYQAATAVAVIAAKGKTIRSPGKHHSPFMQAPFVLVLRKQYQSKSAPLRHCCGSGEEHEASQLPN
jgi:hypothetical protein